MQQNFSEHAVLGVLNFLLDFVFGSADVNSATGFELGSQSLCWSSPQGTLRPRCWTVLWLMEATTSALVSVR